MLARRRLASGSVQILCMILQVPVKVGLERIINRMQVGDKRLDSGALHAFIGAGSHAPNDKELAIGYGDGHACVLVLGIRSVAMSLILGPGVVFVMLRIGARELGVAQLWAALPGNDPGAFNRQDLVKLSPAEVLAYGHTVIGYKGNLHSVPPMLVWPC